jgi:hypothetical protein
METAEKTLMEMITVKDFNVHTYFFELHAQLAAAAAGTGPAGSGTVVGQSFPLSTSSSAASILQFHGGQSASSQAPTSILTAVAQAAQQQSAALKAAGPGQQEPIGAKMRQDRHETEDFYLSVSNSQFINLINGFFSFGSVISQFIFCRFSLPFSDAMSN